MMPQKPLMNESSKRADDNYRFKKMDNFVLTGTHDDLLSLANCHRSKINYYFKKGTMEMIIVLYTERLFLYDNSCKKN